MSCRSRLAVLNEKLTTLERRVEYLEARVSTLTYFWRVLIFWTCMDHVFTTFQFSLALKRVLNIYSRKVKA